MTDRDNAVKIRADRMDGEMDGMATGLSTALLKDGTQTVTANIPMAGFKFTGLGAGSANGNSIRYEQIKAGTEAHLIGSEVIGHTVALLIGGNSDSLEVFGTTAATGGIAFGMFNATPATAAHLDFYKSANAAIGSATVVASGERLGEINFYGAQQTGTFATQNKAAMIRAEADGVVTSGAGADMPGRLVFSTSPDGSGTPTDRMILDSAGVLKPNANDGLALGTGALAFSDLFGATGFVWNLGNGDYTVTHSTGVLTFSGNIVATISFVGATNVVLATTGANTIFLRPNGAASGTGQTTIDSAGLMTVGGALTTTGAFTSLGIDDNATAERFQLADTIAHFGVLNSDYTVSHIDNDRLLSVQGGVVGGTGGSSGSIHLFGADHATQGGDVVIGGQTSATIYYQWDQSAGAHLWYDGAGSPTLYARINGSTNYIAATTRFGQDTTSTPGNGNNTTGAAINAGAGYFSTAGGAGVVINKTADSTNMTFASGGTAQGTISISGATTTYAAFMGSHWAQLQGSGAKIDILRGTIVESVDEMSVWPAFRYTDHDGIVHTSEDVPAGLAIGDTFDFSYERLMVEEQTVVTAMAKAAVIELPNDQLPRFKISDTPGSKSVYGVFAWWDESSAVTNDAFIGALGAYVIRIASGVVVEKGDLIESNGDGCGRVQADDLMRASTVAKITAAIAIETYADGSYIVPCTLHCG